ncbi:hypothetical protein ACVW1A_001294 [Bradyrhizobium sp. LB1.3]
MFMISPASMKKGNGHQRKAVRAVDDVLRHDLRVEHVDRAHQGDAADEERKGDRHAQRHGAEQRERKDGDRHGVIQVTRRK